MIRHLIIFFSLINLSSIAIPCSFGGLEKEIEFESQSSALGVKNAQEIIDWFIKWRDGDGIGNIWVSGYFIKNDTHSVKLAKERIYNIARIIEPLNKNNTPMEISDPDPVRGHGPLAFRSNFAFIVVQPACLKTNTCCPVPISDQKPNTSYGSVR
jgi:hypothetical protein